MTNENPDHEQLELTEREQWLLAQIEAITSGRDERRAADPILEFTRRLVQAQPPGNETLQQQLRAQLLSMSISKHQEENKIMEPNKRPFHLTWRFALTAVLIGLVLLISIILITPTGRAWAQSFLARSGPVLITDDPTLPEQALTRTPEPQPTTLPSSRMPTTSDNIDPAEASALVGFAVFVPEYVPPGYELMRIQPVQAGIEADIEYYAPEETDGYFLLRQIRFQPPAGEEGSFNWPVGDAPVLELTVRGQPGVWVEQSNQGQTVNESGETVMSTWNMLLWQEDEFLFWFFSKNLPQEEMVAIAESLMPVTAAPVLPDQ
ncbi:MAG: DUF4367 domain-containing protein [Chloroflexi bacterium]|nr:DUF4367 domain-containing protein [Chloroflexota bacterium]